MSISFDERTTAQEKNLNRALEDIQGKITVQEAVDITRPLESQIETLVKRVQLLVRRLKQLLLKVQIIKKRG